jgi:protein-tyrosine phosphatase
MPRITTPEFQRLPLRVHDLLAGVPRHDAWAVDLPRTRPGVTLEELIRASQARLLRPSRAARALVRLRLLVGRLLGWDREEAATSESFAARLTPADRTRSLTPAGTREGMFRVVYRFENEQLLEIVNRTAHAAALSALVESADSYRFYFAVYVRPVSRFTPVYMALIDPFRKLIVYPSLLRSVRATWDDAMRPPLAFVPREAHGLRGRLAFCPAPGRWRLASDPDRALEGDLASLTASGVQVLVNLLEQDEMARIGLSRLAERARAAGLEVLWLPIEDGTAPSDLEATAHLVRDILDRLAAGRTVAVHCHGGIGRSGTIAATCLVAAGVTPARALELVRAARPAAATAPGQEEFVYAFAARRSS